MLAEMGNVVITIDEEDMQYYLNRGYDIKDDKCNLIKKAIPRDLASLEKAYIEHEAEIERLKAEIEKLKGADVEKSTKRTKAKQD